MCLIEEFWMELDSVEPATLLLHCLNAARLVRSSNAKPVRQLFHLVTVVMPNSYFRWQSFEEALASVIDWQEPALALRAFVTFAGLNSSHQSHFSAVGNRNLLMPAADAEYWLACLLDNVKHSGY